VIVCSFPPHFWYTKLRLRTHRMENLGHGIIASAVHERVQAALRHLEAGCKRATSNPTGMKVLKWGWTEGASLSGFIPWTTREGVICMDKPTSFQGPDDRSPMNREVHFHFWESAGGEMPRATQLRRTSLLGRFLEKVV
jgi:hypothetical protein